jgi:putative molybdopterin biosynthesis protein
MAFQYLTNTPLEQAQREYLQLLTEQGMEPKIEVLPVSQACGRISAEAVYAQICAPHYHASAMDGIALSAKITFGASETTPVTLAEEQFTVVDTGDPIPEGCDAVIMVEDIIRGEDGSIKIYAAAAPWQHIRQIGEDICAGEMIMPAQMPISPAAVGAMIAGGVLSLKVIKKPMVGIIPTGDEIIQPTDNPEAGDILEFNSAIFSGMLEQWGAVAQVYPIVRDDFCLIKTALQTALAECDMVILNAGSSAGREDYSKDAIASVGQVLYHGIAIRPGKPAILGAAGGKPVLGVPGYPVSGIIVIEQLLLPLIEYWNKHPLPPKQKLKATLSGPIISGLKYQEFVRLRLGYVGDKLIATPLSRGSGVISSFMKADAMLEIEQSREGYAAGAQVEVSLLNREDILRQTLVSIGSHDPMLDELANMLHLRYGDSYMSSAHTGSMGGIMAVRRGEAHLAGIHLLAEEDGSYNLPYLQRYFPKGGVRLLECVGRSQGLMVAPANPLGLEGFADITRKNLRYVNRQKGSGTRILTDYLCRQHNIDTGKIYGYQREEFTHTAVAAQIAAGYADMGMGIWSAAKMYGLDFIPVCIEQYDLLIPDHAWDSLLLQRLLEVLGSADFAAKLEQLGGYVVANPGTVRARL